MKLAIVAPSPVPFVIGGAENLWWGLVSAFNREPGIEAELIKLPSPERNAREILASYRRFAELDVSHFDQVITTKYPAWMLSHPNHVVYVQHKLRGLYDTYPAHLPTALPADTRLPQALRSLITRPDPDRSLLPDLFGALESWFTAHPDDHGFDLPGPLLRAVVHQLDRIALAPGAIRRYMAISHTVAGRADHFPPGVQVEVLHHPTSLATQPASAYEAIFTASRLDGPKRVELLLRAYLKAGVDVPLRIAGSGPEAQRLQRLAEGNPHVSFLGRITEEQLVDEYRRALFVPFIPDREDYGLITLEAMQSGKAVLTVSDAGGVNELVQPGLNGEIVAPDEDTLAEAIRRLCEDRTRTLAMGAAAPGSVAHIDWAATARTLLTPPVRRKKVVVANTFAIYPPQSGGQLRLYHLYKGLARQADVVMVNLTEPGQPARRLALAPGLSEVRVPRALSLAEADRALEGALGVSSGDLSLALFPALAPNYLRALREACEGADVVVASHPYAWAALRKVWPGPIVYESHNMEYKLKAALYPPDTPWLQGLADVEGACAREAPQVFACSEADADRLAEVYDVPRARIGVIPNGVDVSEVTFTPPEERETAKARLGLAGRTLVLFMGSLHQPNVEALETLIAVAHTCPDLDFLIMGNVCQAACLQAASANVHPLGLVSEREKQRWLATADIGFNPMLSGSGTNLKILDYAAAGLVIVSTPFGARGAVLTAPEHLLLAEPDRLAPALMAAARLPLAERQRLVEAARRRIEETVDWPAVADAYARQLL